MIVVPVQKYSPSSLWTTVAREVEPGDFIYIREGIYRENADKGEDGIYWGIDSSQYYAVRNNGGQPGNPSQCKVTPAKLPSLP